MRLESAEFAVRACVVASSAVNRGCNECFVTGATGFLGSHVARCLPPGADLRLLTRSTSRTDNIADLPAERVVGDLRDIESLKRGMAGCEVVFHVAADYRLWARDGQELYHSNVDGTRNILAGGERVGRAAGCLYQ